MCTLSKEKIEYYTEYLKDYNFLKQPDTEELNLIFRTSLNEFGRIICPK